LEENVADVRQGRNLPGTKSSTGKKRWREGGAALSHIADKTKDYSGLKSWGTM